MFLVAVGGLLGTSALIALASPYIVMRMPNLSAKDRTLARYYLAYSGFVITTSICAKVGLSIIGHAANVFFVLLVMLAAGALALFSFRLRPGWFAIATGTLSIVAWFFTLLSLVLTVMFEGNSPATAELGNGLYCRETVYGFAASDSGQDLELFQSYLLVDYSVYRIRQSNIVPGEEAEVPSNLRKSISRCRASIVQHRRSVSGQKTS